MQERVKGGQALGHYDGCKAGDCHMYAHTGMHQFDRVLHIYIYVCYTCPQAGIFAVPGVDLHTQIPHSGPEKGFIRKHAMKHPKDGRKKVVAWAGTPMITASAILSPGN